MAAHAVLRPDFVSRMQEFGDERLGILPEEGLCLQADVVEADVGRAAAVERVVFLGAGAVVVGVPVEIVVDGIVVDHLGD